MPDQNDDVRGGYPVGDRPPGRNGSSPDERSELPVDLAAVQADDELIDALGRTGAVPGSDAQGPEVQGPDAQLRQVLLAWRRDVRRDDDGDLDEPLVDVDTALAVVARAQRPAPRRRPVLVPVAAAAAMAVIAFSGLGLGARAAEPGDTLWPMTKVLYTERARSVEAAVEVNTKLNEARNALQEGRQDAARGALLEADQELPEVDADEGRAELAARSDALRNELGGDTGPTPPATDPSAAATTPPTDADPSSPPQPSTPPASSAAVEPPPPPPPSTDATPPTPAPEPGAGGGTGGGTGESGTGESGVVPPAPRSDTSPAGDAPAPPATSLAG